VSRPKIAALAGGGNDNADCAAAEPGVSGAPAIDGAIVGAPDFEAGASAAMQKPDDQPKRIKVRRIRVKVIEIEKPSVGLILDF
jgi:hypothetical protein